MKRLAMAAGVLVVAAAAALPTSAAADWRVGVVVRNDHDGYGGRSAFRYGYDRGWREGSDEGHRDGRRNRDPRFWRDDDFRDADSGYKRWMGPRHEYRDGFREGFAAGYRRAYASARPGWRGRGHERWERDLRERREREREERERRRDDWR